MRKLLATLMNKYFVNITADLHCIKSIRTQSFSSPYFSAFGLSTDQKNAEYGHFQADLDLKRDSETRSNTQNSMDIVLERFDCNQSILKILLIRLIRFPFIR